MSYEVTMAGGVKDVVLPNGSRYQAGDIVFLSDAEYAQLSPTSGSLFASAQYAGEDNFAVVIADGLDGVVLPTGVRYTAEDLATLTDGQFSTIPRSSWPGLFGSIRVEVH